MMNRYVLITAAKNEEQYIDLPIVSIIEQILKPVEWIIVSDGSTDKTDYIIDKYSSKFPFIRLIKLNNNSIRNFGSQIEAINYGISQLNNIDYDYIGNLDSDISFNNDYFSNIINEFSKDPTLGLAGGVFYESSGSSFRPRIGNSNRSVPHAVQFFRRKCFEDVGGYKFFKYGGSDCFAEIMSRKHGWRVKAFDYVHVYHHRPTLSGEGILVGAFRQGYMDYSLGFHPIYEFLRLIKRYKQKPYFLYSIIRFSGFISAYLKKSESPCVSKENISYIRKEQINYMKAIYKSILPFY